MIDVLTQPFVEFSFMRRALVGCLALSLGAPPVGVFLVLRRMSLMGDAMSHAILPGAAIGYLLAGLSLFAMSAGGLIAGIVVAVLAGIVARSTVLREDASLAAFYLVSLAAGVLIVSVRGSSIDLAARPIRDGARPRRSRPDPDRGDRDRHHDGDRDHVPAAGARMPRSDVSALGEPHQSPTHISLPGAGRSQWWGGFQALGTLMAVGIMLLPAVTARFWAEEVPNLIMVAVVAAFGSSALGLLLSYYANVPSGPAIILTCGVAYLASLLIGPRGSLLRQLLPRKHLDA